jgi:hypothetical protein
MSQSTTDRSDVGIKWFVYTQIAVMAPMAAAILCPPAAIPLAAVGFGVWKSYLKRTEPNVK